MPELVSHPEEVKVISRRWGQGAADIDKYIAAWRLLGHSQVP